MILPHVMPFDLQWNSPYCYYQAVAAKMSLPYTSPNVRDLQGELWPYFLALCATDVFLRILSIFFKWGDNELSHMVWIDIYNILWISYLEEYYLTHIKFQDIVKCNFTWKDSILI